MQQKEKEDTSIRILKALKEIDEANKSFAKLMHIQGELREAYQSIVKDAPSSSQEKEKSKDLPRG